MKWTYEPKDWTMTDPPTPTTIEVYTTSYSFVGDRAKEAVAELDKQATLVAMTMGCAIFGSEIKVTTHRADQP